MNKVIYEFDNLDYLNNNLNDLYQISNNLIGKSNYFDHSSIKVIIQEYKNIKKSKTEEQREDNFENILINEEKDKTSFTSEQLKNPSELRKKILNTFTKYLNNKNNLNIIDFYNNIPSTFSIIYDINRKDSILFSDINQEFLIFYLSNFMLKIKQLRIESKDKKFFKKIPNLMYGQNVKLNNSDKVFQNWFPDSNTYKKILPILNSNDIFLDNIEDKFNYFLKFETDYLKSPFDENKINRIYKKTIKILKDGGNDKLLFLKKNKQSENIIKLIIQENMLDFIGDNVFLEGFNTNSEFYSVDINQNIHKFENKYVTKRLFNVVDEYINKCSDYSSEKRQILTEEYFNYIRNSIAKSMISFYKELFLYYQIMSYEKHLNKDKLIKLYKNNIQNNLDKIDNKKIKKNFDNNLIKSKGDLNSIIEVYNELYKNINDPMKLLNFNQEDALLMKYADYHNMTNEKQIEKKRIQFEKENGLNNH